jgi:hypothetical protein
MIMITMIESRVNGDHHDDWVNYYDDHDADERRKC